MKYPKNQTVNGIKFMQFLSKPVYRELSKRSTKNGILIQELIRAVIIPEYLQNHPVSVSKKRSDAIRKSWETRRKNVEHAESSDEFAAPITPPPWETQSEPHEGDQSL